MRNRTILKEDYSYIVGDDACDIIADADGFYWKDTRYLSEYRWEFTEKYSILSRWEDQHDRAEFILSWFDDPSQHVGIRRRITVSRRGFTDSLSVENTDLVRHRFAADLHLKVDFSDVFIARGFDSRQERSVTVTPSALSVTFLDESSSDELVVRYETGGSASINWSGETIRVHADLEPRETIRVSVTAEVVNRRAEPGDERFADGPELPVTERWVQRLDEQRVAWQLTDVEYRVARQAATDLRALLLASPDGIIPAAGIPWFAAAFGRDAIITSIFAKELYPELMAGTLQFLAHHQGRETNDFRAEAPGKIMHELRFGELTRSGIAPHGPYYGTVDATPLFVVLAGEALASGKADFRESIVPAVAGALRWMESDGDGNDDGFLDYETGDHDGGLTVQSWKDSGESMSHRDGSLATGRITPVEVQGYAYAAYEAAASLYARIGDGDRKDYYRDKADTLKQRFHETFWIDSLGIYAMALDGDNRPLEVQSSNAGQLLWTGIVPEEFAERLVRTLFSDELWSGWGIRTLGTSEVRYNPVSYHNGSVWPHDSATIALGLWRYGYREEASRIRDAIFDLGWSQPDKRVPELISGSPRRSGPPAVYPVACRPQAWDAAAVIALAGLTSAPCGRSTRPG